MLIGLSRCVLVPHYLVKLVCVFIALVFHCLSVVVIVMVVFMTLSSVFFIK